MGYQDHSSIKTIDGSTIDGSKITAGDGRPTVETAVMILDGELGVTAELVAGLFHRLDTVLRRPYEDDDSETKGPTPAESSGGPWSRVQEEIRGRVAMVERLNRQLRELHDRIDL